MYLTRMLHLLVLGISIYVVTQRAHDFKSASDTQIFGSAAIDHTIEKFLDDFAAEYLNSDLQVARDKFEQTVCTFIRVHCTIQYPYTVYEYSFLF